LTRYRRTSLGAVGLSAAITIVAGCGGPGSATLVRTGESPTGNCKHASSDADWRHLQSTSTQFGLDDFELKNQKTRVTVLSATLVKPVGGITLTNVAMQAFGGVGGAIDWNSDASPTSPVSVRLQLPADLDYTQTSPGNATADGLTWQLAIGVRVTGGDGGSAQAVALTYKSGGHTHTIVGLDRFGIFRTEQECQTRVIHPVAG
jgi:hypothetical protein